MALVVGWIFFQWGCASKQAGSLPAQEGAGVVGVVTPSDTWKGNLKPLSVKGAAAASGAGRGARAGAMPGLAILGGMGGCAGGGSVGAVICGTIGLFGLGLAATGSVLGALGGAMHGAATAEPPFQEATKSLDAVITHLPLQAALLEDVLTAGASRRSDLRFVRLPYGSFTESAARATPGEGANVETVLEVTLDDIQFQRYGSGPEIWVALVVSARARVIRASDGRELRRHVASHQSTPWSHEEWAADDARHLREALAVASTSMATSIVDVLLARPEPDS
jgi:hypothetical protein